MRLTRYSVEVFPVEQRVDMTLSCLEVDDRVDLRYAVVVRSILLDAVDHAEGLQYFRRNGNYGKRYFEYPEIVFRIAALFKDFSQAANPLR